LSILLAQVILWWQDLLPDNLNTKDMEKAFRLGVTAGSASAFCSWLATRDEIVALLGEPAEVYHI